MKQTDPGTILVGGAPGTTSNSGKNHPASLKLEANGKGVGNLPAYNQPYMSVASENTDPMTKHEQVGKIVGE